MTVHPYSRIFTGKTTAPTVNDDSSLNYEVGDEWIDETNNVVYQAVDVTVGAAVWTSGSGGGLTNPVEYIDFSTSGTATPNTEGRLSWNPDDGTLNVGLPGGNVVLQLGQEQLVPRRVKNNTASNMLNGQLVHIVGGDGNNAYIELAKADSEATSANTIAMLTEDIAAGQKGYATISGLVRGDALQPIDTSAWTPGTVLYLSATTAGAFTNTQPVAPNHLVKIGQVFRQHATEGAIIVAIDNGYELDELHDVYATGTATGDTLIRYGNVWKNMPIYSDTKDPTGWINPTSISVSYNTTNRTITLTGDLSYYWRGIKYQLTSPWTSSAHDAADGQYYLYSSDGVNITWSTSVWTFDMLMVSKAVKSTSPAYQFAIKETHGLMPWEVHQELHTIVSSYRTSGGALTAGTYAENTATNDANSPGFDSAVIKDEDDIVDIPAWSASGTYTTLRIGAGQLATFDTTATLPFRSGGSYIYINNPTTGAETASTNNRYLNVYQVLIPATTDTDSQKYRMVMLQPQRDHPSLADAQAESPSSLSFGDLTNTTPEFVIYARITYVTSAGDLNTGKCRIATGGVSYITGSRLAQASISGINNHNDLSGLQGGTIDEYYHLTTSEYTGSGTGTFVRSQYPVIDVRDTEFVIHDDGNLSRSVRFQLSSIITGTASAWVFPHTTTGTFVSTNLAQTLTNKTITAPVITLNQASTTPTAEGDIRWDAVNDAIKVGASGTTTTFRHDGYYTGTFALIANGVTNGNSHNHLGGDGGVIMYTSISGTPTVREVLTGARTYYVATTGSDSNTGLASGTPFLTIQKAVDVASAIDNNGYDITLSVAAGTYTITTKTTLKEYLGAGKITIDLTTASLTTASNTDLFSATNLSSIYRIKGGTLSGTVIQRCVYVENSTVELEGVTFGALTGGLARHIQCISRGYIRFFGNYSITGSASYHILNTVGSVVIISSASSTDPTTITLTGTPNFSTAFASLSRNSTLLANSTALTFSGAATGTRYSVTLNSVLDTSGGGATYLPGDVAGTTATGGQYA
jgi:hypothetical protein